MDREQIAAGYPVKERLLDQAEVSDPTGLPHLNWLQSQFLADFSRLAEWDNRHRDQHLPFPRPEELARDGESAAPAPARLHLLHCWLATDLLLHWPQTEAEWDFTQQFRQLYPDREVRDRARWFWADFRNWAAAGKRDLVEEYALASMLGFRSRDASEERPDAVTPEQVRTILSPQPAEPSDVAELLRDGVPDPRPLRHPAGARWVRTVGRAVAAGWLAVALAILFLLAGRPG